MDEKEQVIANVLSGLLGTIEEAKEQDQVKSEESEGDEQSPDEEKRYSPEEDEESGNGNGEGSDGDGEHGDEEAGDSGSGDSHAGEGADGGEDTAGAEDGAGDGDGGEDGNGSPPEQRDGNGSPVPSGVGDDPGGADDGGATPGGDDPVGDEPDEAESGRDAGDSGMADEPGGDSGDAPSGGEEPDQDGDGPEGVSPPDSGGPDSGGGQEDGPGSGGGGGGHGSGSGGGGGDDGEPEGLAQQDDDPKHGEDRDRQWAGESGSGEPPADDEGDGDADGDGDAPEDRADPEAGDDPDVQEGDEPQEDDDQDDEDGHMDGDGGGGGGDAESSGDSRFGGAGLGIAAPSISAKEMAEAMSAKSGMGKTHSKSQALAKAARVGFKPSVMDVGISQFILQAANYMSEAPDEYFVRSRDTHEPGLWKYPYAGVHACNCENDWQVKSHEAIVEMARPLAASIASAIVMPPVVSEAWTGNLMSGPRLDPRKAHQIIFPSERPRIFKDMTTKTTDRYCVLLVVDCSGSMGGFEKMPTVAMASVALRMALAEFGCDVQIATYPHDVQFRSTGSLANHIPAVLDMANGSKVPLPHREELSRWYGVTLSDDHLAHVQVALRDSLSTIRGGYSVLATSPELDMCPVAVDALMRPTGGTPAATALMMALHRAIRWRNYGYCEKVAIVHLTDGEPNPCDSFFRMMNNVGFTVPPDREHDFDLGADFRKAQLEYFASVGLPPTEKATVSMRAYRDIERIKRASDMAGIPMFAAFCIGDGSGEVTQSRSIDDEAVTDLYKKHYINQALFRHYGLAAQYGGDWAEGIGATALCDGVVNILNKWANGG